MPSHQGMDNSAVRIMGYFSGVCAVECLAGLLCIGGTQHMTVRVCLFEKQRMMTRGDW